KQENKTTSQSVYETMLGLKNKNTYDDWTSALNPTSSYEGSWKQGSKIYFNCVDENGKRGGMVAKIEEHEPAKFVSIMHYGYMDDDRIITTAEQAEMWAVGHENYSFQEYNGTTSVTVDVDFTDDQLDYFKTIYPKALKKLKEISER